MRLLLSLALPGVCALLAGCPAASRASNRDTLPEDNVTQCRSLCASAGGSLQSIVIVANETGCVCNVAGGEESLDSGTGAAAGGVVASLIEEEERRRRQQQQQQQQ